MVGAKSLYCPAIDIVCVTTNKSSTTKPFGYSTRTAKQINCGKLPIILRDRHCCSVRWRFFAQQTPNFSFAQITGYIGNGYAPWHHRLPSPQPGLRLDSFSLLLHFYWCYRDMIPTKCSTLNFLEFAFKPQLRMISTVPRVTVKITWQSSCTGETPHYARSSATTLSTW